MTGASVVVVGASNPTGFAIVQAFLAQGASVEVLVRTPEQGELIGLKLGAPPHLSCRTVDFTDPEDCEVAARAILAERGPVDHAISCVRYGPRGDALWGGVDEIGGIDQTMAATWLPRLCREGSYQFIVSGDRPTVGLQPKGPALLSDFDKRASEWGPDRRVFVIAAGPVPSEVGAESVRLALDAGVDSARILMPGAFAGDPSWEQLISARLGLNTRLAQRSGNAGPS